ncbi:UNVERIFIED_CONTAM: hypothetical protein DV099_09445 [Bifidobacterium longum]|nr:hypothetical protein [Bifidobacterium longum]RGW05219.1 hypothetical protein DWV93_09205 [Bifidobacterium longum]RGW12538.1 hypothetical protein DWV88_10195 [Bifidobacterium longum]
MHTRAPECIHGPEADRTHAPAHDRRPHFRREGARHAVRTLPACPCLPSRDSFPSGTYGSAIRAFNREQSVCVLSAAPRHARRGHGSTVSGSEGPGKQSVSVLFSPRCMHVCICMHPGMHTEKARKKPENPYK